MRPRPVSVRQLADEIGSDVDSVLLSTWDLGHLDGRALNVLNGSDKIPAKLVDSVRRSLGIATQRELHTVTYWSKLLGMSTAELRIKLSEEGYTLSAKQRKLSPGIRKCLMQFARAHQINPLTGETTSTAPAKHLTSRRQIVRRAPPDFRHVGRRPRTFRWLGVEDVLKIHDALVLDFARSGDPIAPPGTRSRHLLESAVFRPQTGFDGKLKYPTVETSAAALLCALINNHPFHNGNKRTALVSLLAFLDLNGVVLTCSADQLFQFVFLIAMHKLVPGGHDSRDDGDLETLAAANNISQWARTVRTVGVTPSMPFRKLQGILERRGCSVRIVGSRARIERKRPAVSRSPFARPLRSRIPYRDDGTDVPSDQVKKIRQALQLDPEHGHDDDDFFFSRKPTSIDDFIVTYRKILERLAAH